MIYSMTGYGRSIHELPDKKVTIEVKSLNSKHADISVNIPNVYKEKELYIRKQISSRLLRGKINLSIYVEKTFKTPVNVINADIITNYMTQLKQIVSHNDDMALLSMALKLPDVLQSKKEDFNYDEWQHIEQQITLVINDLMAYRLKEGKVLEIDFKDRIAQIDKIRRQISILDPERIVHVKKRLLKNIEELKEAYDKNRFEQELIYYIEKYDITEENVRLKSHINYFLECLSSDTNANGKKLGFIAQEIGREINTIGSKSNYAPMQKLVVQMKDELEKIKEQLLNIL